MVFQLNKLESPSSKDALCQVWLKLDQPFWRRGFKNFVNVVLLVRNDIPLAKGWALRLNELESPRMHWTKFGWKLYSLKKGGALQLNKLESPSPRDALCQVWLKLAQWFWRRLLNFVNVFSLFRNYLHLEKGGALHLKKLEFPHLRMLCAKFGWNLPSGSGEEDT